MIIDNGAAFCICVDGLMVEACHTLGAAWNHVAWMHRIAMQKFTVGEKEIPVSEWIESGIRMGFFDEGIGYRK